MKKSQRNIKYLLILCFQLLVILVLASLGTFYLNKLAESSANIVKDNLRSLRYCAAMQKALHNIRNSESQLLLESERIEFENNLRAEKNNITESGEKELADKIEADYTQWYKSPTDSIYDQLVTTINSVNELNISAIEKKNETTQKVASDAFTFILMSFFGGLATFLITFFFIGSIIQSPKGNEEELTL